MRRYGSVPGYEPRRDRRAGPGLSIIARLPGRTGSESPMGLARGFVRVLLSCLTLVSACAFGQGAPVLSSGQLLYLPVYSHVWHGEVDRKSQPTKSLVSVLVSVRNTDTSKSIQLVSAQYYDTDGRRIKEYVDSPKKIGPMGTYELFVPRSDDTGGSGANFVIRVEVRRRSERACRRGAPHQPAGGPVHRLHHVGAGDLCGTALGRPRRMRACWQPDQA